MKISAGLMAADPRLSGSKGLREALERGSVMVLDASLRQWPGRSGATIDGAYDPGGAGVQGTAPARVRWRPPMRRASALAATILLLAPAGVAQAGPPRDFRLGQAVQGRQPTKVLAYLDVRDGDARPVSDGRIRGSVSATLGEQSLQVDRVVPFSDAGEGVAFIFCVDISKSLSAADFAEVRSALGRWIDEMRPLDRAAVLSVRRGRAGWCSTSARTRPRCARRSRRWAPTDMTDGALPRPARRARAVVAAGPELPARRVVVVLSDGKDEGSALAAEDVLVALRERGLPLYAIGFGGARRRESLDLLLRFATNSGGRLRRGRRR